MLSKCILMAASDNTTRALLLLSHFLGQSQSALHPPSAPFVSFMYTECKHRRIQGLVLSSVLILYCKHGVVRPCSWGWLGWQGPETDQALIEPTCLSLIRNQVCTGVMGRAMRTLLSGALKAAPFPRRMLTAQEGLLVEYQGQIIMMGTSADALTLVFKPLSSDSPQNFKDAVAEDKYENKPKKRK